MPTTSIATVTTNQRLILAFVHTANPYHRDEICQFAYNARPHDEWESLRGIYKIIDSLVERDLIARVTSSDRSPYTVTPEGLPFIKWHDWSKTPPETSDAG